jgi:hypothetical protein
MTPLLSTTELGDFAIRAVERPGPNDWLALVAPTAEVGIVAKKLAEELSAIGDKDLSPQNVSSVSALVELAVLYPEGVLAVSGFDAFTPDDWKLIDRERSLLQRQGITVLVLGDEALSRLFDHAPNLASWLGGAAWRLDRKAHVLTAEKREVRLAALRLWAGWEDSEVIARAERGDLPPDPPFSEWLVLLGRGDLLGK